MDSITIQTYDSLAARYADDWLSQPAPKEIHEVVTTYFKLGASTVDIGCGCGRDVAWLSRNGYPCVGYDGSDGLLIEARARFPDFEFSKSLLPKLGEIDDDSFDNVACETVLMHLPACEHQTALQNLLRITRPGGVVHVSWRLAPDNSSARDENQRLYEPVDVALLIDSAHKSGAVVLEQKTFVSASTSKPITHLVIQKSRKAISLSHLFGVLALYASIWIFIALTSMYRFFGTDAGAVINTTMIASALAWIKFDGQPFRSQRTIFSKKLIPFMVGIVGFAGFALWALKMSHARDPFVEEAKIYGIGYVFLTSALAAPIVEELFFRQAIFATLERYIQNPTWLITANAGLFAFYHMSAFSMGFAPYLVMQLGATLVLGVLFSAVRWQSRSIVLTIAMHILYNTIILLGAWSL